MCAKLFVWSVNKPHLRQEQEGGAESLLRTATHIIHSHTLLKKKSAFNSRNKIFCAFSFGRGGRSSKWKVEETLVADSLDSLKFRGLFTKNCGILSQIIGLLHVWCSSSARANQMDSYWHAVAAPVHRKLGETCCFSFFLSNWCDLKCSEVQYFKQNLLK